MNTGNYSFNRFVYDDRPSPKVRENNNNLHLEHQRKMYLSSAPHDILFLSLQQKLERLNTNNNHVKD